VMIDQINLLKNLGLFLIDGFLDQSLCMEIDADIRSSKSSKAAKVHQSDGRYGVDEKIRKVNSVMVSDTLNKEIMSRLEAIKSDLENHFSVELKSIQRPDYLLYQTDSFYKMHRDTYHEPKPGLGQRQISVVVFINSESPNQEHEMYCGGALMVYDLLRGNSDAKSLGISVNGKSGLLVAFPSETMHEVQPVTFGDRLTFVSWFLGDKVVKQQT
jgi:predicted 2-oxoglutarate/Fe(II)-dependent dioxygenase YbiX